MGERVETQYAGLAAGYRMGLGVDERLYLLQSRPITSLYPLPDAVSADPLLVLGSFGAMQGMLDPITPLGQDAIKRLIVAMMSVFGQRRKS